MRSLRNLILFFVAIVAVAFAVANRHLVPFVLDPMAGFVYEAPLYVYMLAALLSGFLIGALASWLGQSRWRNAARKRAHEVFELKKENERLTRHLRVMERAPQIRAFAAQADVQERPLIH